MKLVKLSLATALVAGALTTTSFATPLEEAVKDVDLGGYMFVRYTFDQNKDKVYGNDHKTKGTWRFKSEVNLKTKVDDNFFGVAGLRIDANGQNTRDGGEVAKAPYDVYNLHLGYNVGGTTVLVGRQNIDTFFTDDLFGDGVAVLNSDIEGLTLAALWMDNLYNDGDIVDQLSSIEDNATILKAGRDRIVNNDLFGAAVIGSYDPIAFQLWAARLTSTADLYAGEVTGSFDVADDVNVGFKAQVGASKINSGFEDFIKTALDAEIDGTTFFGGELSSAFFGADVAAGYVQYGKKGKLSLVSLEDDGKFLKAGEQTDFYYSLFQDKNNAFYVTAGYAIPDSDVKVGLDYVHHENKAEDSKTKQDEIVARAGYAYNSKLNFSGYASYLKVKEDGQDNTNNTQVRFTAKYSF